MRKYPSKKGPFRFGQFYTDEEFENICTDELRSAGLHPSEHRPVRIERFIEKRFGVTPQYEDLGEGVLGLTKFGPKGVQAVIVARSLDEEGTKAAERRIRTTLAHEAGHGLLHAHLFVLDAAERPLFGDFSDPQAPKILCRDVEGNDNRRPGYDGRWWEFQANRAIGALLLPKQLVFTVLEPFLEPVGLLGMKDLPSGRRDEAARSLADIFEVNPAVARIRLQHLYPASTEAQLRL